MKNQNERPKLLDFLSFIFRKPLNVLRFFTSCNIPIEYLFRRDVRLPHCVGIVIGRTAKVGSNVTILSNVVLGNRGKHGKKPTIQDDVYIGAGAKVIGGVTVGKGAKIGANAVVVKDVKPYTTVIGVPAREIK